MRRDLSKSSKMVTVSKQQDEGSENRHFASTSEEEKKRILTDRKSKGTQQSTESKMRCFNAYLKEKGYEEEGAITDADLPNVMLNFYSDLCKTNGDIYKLNSLKGMHAGINRHMKETRGIDIVSDPCFLKANEMFDGIKVKAKKQGKAVTNSKKVIRNRDMELISEYFSYNHHLKPDAKLLQERIIFNILYFFCHRGRENLHKLMKEHFKVFTDEDGKKFIAQNLDEMDKNHCADDPNLTNEGHMYATGKQKKYPRHQNVKKNCLWLKQTKGSHY